ncbi:hypothetical protein LTR17_001028 [Elasticomyces elasticus]|nr:hypothetical protein LTR17_001028 [Elasticomyces elasticus]
MAPNPIVGRYKIYKKGTNKFVAWLAKTASRCSDITDILTTVTPSTPAATIKIRTRELIALAKAIASARPPIELSASVLKACEDVIAGRQACAEWYAAQAIQDNSDLAEQNRTHVFFIDTLKKVHELLSTCKQQAPSPAPNHTTTKKTKGGKVKKKPAAALENMFGNLDVEEPSASPLGEVSKRNDQSLEAQASLATAEIELEDDGNDDALAIWCLLQDLNDVRKFVCITWSEYCSGELSLMAATVVTDTAFGLIRGMNEDFELTRPHLKNWWDLEKFLDIRMSLMGNLVWMVPATKGGLPKNASSDVNPAELLCPSAAFLLRYYGNYTRALMDIFGTVKKSYVDDKDMYMLPPVPGFEQVLIQTTMEVALFAVRREESRGKERVKGAADEYLDGLVEYCIGEHLPIWLVVATQTCMEVFDLVNSNPKCGVDTLAASVIHDRAVVSQSRTFYEGFQDAYLKRFRETELENMTKGYEKLIRTMDECDHEDVTDTGPSGPDASGTMLDVQESRRKLFCRTGTPLQWMLRFPLMPGKMMHTAKLNHLSNGTMLVNDGAIVLAVAHLYKAATHYGLLTESWHDMDWLLAQHGSKQPLVTKLNIKADHDAILRHYLMALGVPASTFSRNARPELPRWDKIVTGGRSVHINSDFHIAMCAQVQETKKRLGPLSTRVHCEAVDVVLRQLADKAAATSTHKKSSNQSSTSMSVTPIQLLSLYKAEFIADEPKLNFNYIGFLELCANMLLTEVATAVITYLPEPEMRPCKISCGYELVHFLLLDAAETTARGLSITSSVIAHAATAMQAVITGNSKTFTQQAFNVSSGRIPKHLRPHFSQREVGFTEAQYHRILQGRGIKLGTRMNHPMYDPLATLDDLPGLKAGNAEYDLWEETGYDAEKAPRDMVGVMMGYFNGTDQERWDKAVAWLRCSHYEMAKMKGKGWVKGFPSVT